MKIFQKTSQAFLWLVFSFLVIACKEDKKENRQVVIATEGSSARAMIVPRELLKGLSEEAIRKSFRVHLKGNLVPVLGELTVKKKEVIFEPLVAFTRGYTYEVRLAAELLTELTIRPADIEYAPGVLNIYPSADTLPENLLKLYIEFSKPMQEGHALENIFVIKNKSDTVKNIFLDLQPELWNAERTILTLWLDPGRIKRDLQPNIKVGSPLERGSQYTLVIKKDWLSADGQSFATPYKKVFVVGTRDAQSPDPTGWKVHSPPAGTRQPLKIELFESLDYLLLKNALRLTDQNGKIIEGVAGTSQMESIFHFTPSVAWQPGAFTLEIESRLEDLAGNNLDRLFDRDLMRDTVKKGKEVYKRFNIH